MAHTHTYMPVNKGLAGAIQHVAFTIINNPEKTESCLPGQINNMVITACCLLLVNGHRAPMQEAVTHDDLIIRLAGMLSLAQVVTDNRWERSFLMEETGWQREQADDFIKACHLLVALDLTLVPEE